MAATSGSGSGHEVERAMVAGLRAALRGEVIDRAHPGYHEARAVWNGLIDRQPAVIARCADTADVVEAVRAAAEHRPPVSIRGGGHQVAGSAVCDDGLVIDLSAMKGIQVDPVARRARAQAGVTWGELDRETQQFGLATPGGEVSTTGIAGLTLGGGMGFQMRLRGLSCDNLHSVEIVTGDGQVRIASHDQHPDLFWAARGGGRGLGVVTWFEFELHPLGPEVAVAQYLYPYTEAERVLRAFRDLAPDVADTVAPELVLWTVPADPAIPAELHGTPTVLVAGVHVGAPADAAGDLAPLRELGPPLLDMSVAMPFLDVQSAFDGLVPPGGRYYMKSHFLDEISDDAIAALLDCYERNPCPETLIVLRTLGGAISRFGVEDSAYPHRTARFNLSIDPFWFDPALDEAAIKWARSTWDTMRPFATGGVYVNFAGLSDDADHLTAALYGPHQERLDRIRTGYDSEGVFASAARRP